MSNLQSARERIWNGLSREKKFSPQNIAEFSHNHNQVLGNGDSATVYKGQYGGHSVAIKNRKLASGQGEKAFLTEVVVLSRYAHPNMVRFFGCSRSQAHGIVDIIIEFMPNGSLESHLNGRHRPFSWERLLHILISIARAIAHLHSHRVTHRDIASRNILLDRNFEGKLNDMGLCKIPEGQYGSFFATPVYPNNRAWTTQEDVLQFGHVLMEVLHWKRSLDQRRQQLHWIQGVKRQGRHTESQTQEIHSNWQASSHSRDLVVNTAFQCLQQSPHARPTMNVVVVRLQQAVQLQGGHHHPHHQHQHQHHPHHHPHHR